MGPLFEASLSGLAAQDRALLIVACLAALAYFPLSERPTGAARSLFKTLPLALLTLVAARAEAPAVLTLALALSALGDFALSRRGEGAFLAGLVAFALAHLAYLGLFVPRVATVDIGAGVAMLAVGAAAVVFVLPRSSRLMWPARLYAGIILAMTWAALSLPVSYRAVTLGAVLFLLSDLALATRKFRLAGGSVAARIAGGIVWTFYIAGQSLILAGFL